MNERKEIPIGKIKVGEHEQRLDFNELDIQGLANSIGRVGLIYPCIVRAEGDSFVLVEGHRRLAAHKKLGRETVPCVEIDVEKATVSEIALAGNFFHKDLSPVELASSISDVIKSGSMTVEEMAVGFHKTPHWVKSMVAICDWPADVLEVLHAKGISVSAASNLACVTDDAYRDFLLRNAVEQGATARTTSAWLQAWRTMQPQEEAIQAEPLEGLPIHQPIIPQSPCFCCSQVFAVNEMSHVPVCGACVQILRAMGSQQS
jgi:ParB family chromosome partitioning protein